VRPQISLSLSLPVQGIRKDGTDVPFKSFVASFITYTTRSVLFLPRTPSLAISTPPSSSTKYLNFLLLPDIMAQNTDIATRAIIVTLKSPLVGMKTSDVVKKLGCSARQVQRIYGRAIERGFDPNETPFVLKDKWLQDAPRSGRPTKQTPETTQAIVAKVQHDRYGQERTCADLAGELSQIGINISATTI